MLLVNCRPLMDPVNGILGNYTSQRVGAIVSYKCIDGYRPSQRMYSICTNTSTWDPAPEDHVCTLVVGKYLTLCIASVLILVSNEPH